MYCFTIFLTNILLVYTVLCNNVGQRDPKYIRGVYTTTVMKTSTATKIVPSSCVQVDATLPPCRRVRFAFPWKASDTNKTTNNTVSQPEPKSDSTLSTPLGWGEYLGIYAPTVTVVEKFVVTTVVPDPNIVVTYSAKGCRPSQLPDNLERCPIEEPVPISSVLPTTTVVPTSTVAARTTEDGRLINVVEGTSFPVTDINENVNSILESSNGEPEDVIGGREAKATDPLPF